MAQVVRSVLLVDYDSLYASLRESSQVAAEWLAGLSGVWLDAIEDGELVVQRRGEPHKRRLLVKRCYADPKLLGNQREGLIAQGFQIIDCLPLSGRERNAAEISMVLDAVDLVSHAAPYDEFILLSADTDLTPILLKLRQHNRATAVYAGRQTSNSYKAFADAFVDEAKLAAAIEAEHDRAGLPQTRTPPPPPVPVKAIPAAPSAAREELSDLARRIHDATKVPLYAPATYADLFKFLTEEVASNGYHFQQTAENVANRLNEAGRSVTKRQIGFVVKGLALKGHPFTAEDKPEALAAGFREQVLYLAGNADLKLSERDTELVSTWIVGTPGDHPEIDIPTGDAAVELAKKGETAEVAQFPAKRAKPAIAPPPAPAAALPPEAAPVDERSAATIAVEDSILAAIAEAVDVLVDKPAPSPTARPAPAGQAKASAPQRPPSVQTKPPAAPGQPPAGPAGPAQRAVPAPAPPQSPAAEDDDIGNEIQKILAGYAQTRQEGGGRR